MYNYSNVYYILYIFLRNSMYTIKWARLISTTNIVKCPISSLFCSSIISYLKKSRCICYSLRIPLMIYFQFMPLACMQNLIEFTISLFFFSFTYSFFLQYTILPKTVLFDLPYRNIRVKSIRK